MKKGLPILLVTLSLLFTIHKNSLGDIIGSISQRIWYPSLYYNRADNVEYTASFYLSSNIPDDDPYDFPRPDEWPGWNPLIDLTLDSSAEGMTWTYQPGSSGFTENVEVLTNGVIDVFADITENSYGYSSEDYFFSQGYYDGINGFDFEGYTIEAISFTLDEFNPADDSGSINYTVTIDGEPIIYIFYRDADGDGFGDPTDNIEASIQPDGYVDNSFDCNDHNSSIHPNATETCNGTDDDCDGSTDEGVQNTYYRDADGDGYGNENNSTQACTVPVGYVTDFTDCNDSSASIHPGASEICGDGIDQDCTGSDLPCPSDLDNDGDGFSPNQGDCNDGNSSINPDATELPYNDIDDDCNPSTRDNDLDNDGHPFPADCNDNDAAINPTASEIADDGIDQDCDGEDLISGCTDRDGDGFYAEDDCGSEIDCNDSVDSIYPGATEVINDGIDQDCDELDFRVDVEEGNIISVEFLWTDDPIYSEEMPDDLVCDPISVNLTVPNAGGTAVFVVNLINGAPQTYIPYKYTQDGWIDFSRNIVSGGTGDGAEFIDSERKQLRVYVTDGDRYDNNTEDGIIGDPITVAAPGFVTPQGDVDVGEDSSGGGSGGGGCFIDLLH